MNNKGTKIYPVWELCREARYECLNVPLYPFFEAWSYFGDHESAKVFCEYINTPKNNRREWSYRLVRVYFTKEAYTKAKERYDKRQKIKMKRRK